MIVNYLGDYTVKKVKRDKYVPLPDNIIDQARKEADSKNSINITEADGRASSLSSINEVIKKFKFRWVRPEELCLM
jgi:hypothetical protein